MRIKIKEKNQTALITLTEAKDQLNIDTAFTGKDTMVSGLILAASAYVEGVTGRYITEQSIQLICDSWDEVQGQLPFGNFQSVTSITYLDTDGNEQTVSSSDYIVGGVDTDEGRILFEDTFDFPELYDIYPITVEIVIGYPMDDTGDTDDYLVNVPDSLKFATRLYVESLYDKVDLAATVNALLSQYRSYRQC